MLASIAGHHFISESPEALALAAGISGVTSLADYAATLGHAGIATLATAPGRFAEAHAIVHRYFGPHVLLGDEVATATHKHIKTFVLFALLAAHGV